MALIFDTDPGVDDTLALMALAKRGVTPTLITTTAGNLSLDEVTKNAQRVVSFTGMKTVIAKGMAEGFTKHEHPVTTDVHGTSGLPSTTLMAQEVNNGLVTDKNYAQAMADIIRYSKEPTTILCCGKVSNVVSLFMSYPGIKDKIKEVIVMGGSTTSGNVTSWAEFNAISDPVALDMLMDSGVNLTMVGLDVTEKYQVPNSVISNMAEVPRELLQSYGDRGNKSTPVHDIFTVYQYLTGALSCGRFQGRVVLRGDKIGYTDYYPNKRSPMQVAQSTNREEFITWVKEVFND